MDMLGIENGTVSGEAGNEQHIWNTVMLDGQWYHVDVTWDDPIGSSFEYTDHAYFNISAKIWHSTTHGTGISTLNMRTAAQSILI